MILLIIFMTWIFIEKVWISLMFLCKKWGVVRIFYFVWEAVYLKATLWLKERRFSIGNKKPLKSTNRLIVVSNPFPILITELILQMAYFDVSDFFFVPVLQLGEGQFYLQVLGFKRLWSIEQSLAWLITENP